MKNTVITKEVRLKRTSFFVFIFEPFLFNRLVFLAFLPADTFFTEVLEWNVFRSCRLHWIGLDGIQCFVKIITEEVFLRLVRIRFALSQRFDTGLDLGRSCRQFVDTYADCVVDRVDDSHMVG